MMIFLRNMVIACLGMMLLVGMLAAGAVIWLIFLGGIVLFMLYTALRKAGIINPYKSSAKPFDPQVIEAEYTVVSESEKQITPEKV
jgi:hypothetical protein